MARQEWLITLIAPARDHEGRAAQVICGLIRWRGQARVALRIGEHGQVVTLADGAARELIANLQAATDERGAR